MKVLDNMLISEPWPHMIVDDYYDNDLFINAKKEIIAFLIKRRPKRRLVYSTHDATFSKNLPETTKCLNSVDPLIYAGYFKNHRKYTTPKIHHEVSFIISEFEYPIHDEIEKKVFSFVTYIAPANGIGTLIYDKNKNYVKEVEWKTNRTLIFAGLTGITWHNYKADNRPRITINTFLTT